MRTITRHVTFGELSCMIEMQDGATYWNNDTDMLIETPEGVSEIDRDKFEEEDIDKSGYVHDDPTAEEYAKFCELFSLPHDDAKWLWWIEYKNKR